MEQKIIYLDLFILTFFILSFYGISRLETKTNLFIKTVQNEAIDLLYDPIVSPHNMAYSYVIKEYNKKIAYCVLPKNLSTKIKKFMEKLKNSKIIYNKNYKNDSDFVNNKTYESVSYNKKNEIIVNNEDWFWFTIQRNPVERFISSFVDKCINEGSQKKFGYETCYGCHNDIHCLLSIQLMRARLLIRNSSYIEESYGKRKYS
ncbi:Sulfotransferase family-containing protein [Strongyloides ratti]|uniref:Sulfotransferase family-containing protein n=1 Tax=Strongyloides ratti TaxID=34506 RepID=A0A090L805_STRRB|nr:Sulfotransferase family-containing protein [Strongyloides ratti]CEF65877.2 Sulfotransferase family-containing protein [Strongyloides ratti]